MNTIIKNLLVIGFIALFGISCSSGGEEDDGQIGTGGVPVKGIAADKNVLSGREIIMLDGNGEKLTATTGDDGFYQIDVKGKKEPFIIKTIAENGREYYSVATNPGIANINPLSDIVIRNWFSTRFGNSSLEEFFENKNIPTELPKENDITIIVSLIGDLLKLAYQKFGIDLDFNFLMTNYIANGHNQQGKDEFAQFLQYLEVIIENNRITLYITDPVTGITATIMVLFDLGTDLSLGDNLPPSEPTELTLLNASENKIVILWNPSIDNFGVTGYEVYRDKVLDREIGITPFPYFIDSDLQPDTRYCYSVRAFDAKDNKSAISNSRCITTPNSGETDPPDVPTNFTATPIGSATVGLSWTASQASDVLGYDIYKTINQQETKIATVVTTSFDDSNLLPDTEYCYSIQAFDALLNRSDKEGPQCATTEEQNLNDTSPPVSEASIKGGTYNVVQNVILSCDDGGGLNVNCIIHYTLNGSVPTTSSPIYNNLPIVVSTNTTLRFFAKDTVGNLESPANYEVYIISIDIEDATPPGVTANPMGGTYYQAQNITLSCSDGGGSGCNAIFYSLDGAAAKSEFLFYTQPIVINSTSTLRYYAVDNAELESDIQTQEYLFIVDVVPPVSIATPGGATYSSPQSVELSCDDGEGSGCSAIFFTTDISAPKDLFTQYTNPITFNADTVLRYFARDNAGVEEAQINQETYIISSPIDTTAPSISSNNYINNGASATDSLTVNLHLVANDNVGVTAYCVKENDTGIAPATPANDDACWKNLISDPTVDTSVSYTFTGPYSLDTTIYSYLWIRDAERLMSVVATDSIVYTNVIACKTSILSGLVAGQTWNEQGSPYCITGDIQVSLLTIEAGVEVLVDGPYSISVLSTIIAVGNQSAPIRFSARQPSAPINQRWKGLKFQNTPAGSVFHHVIFEYSDDSGVTLTDAIPPEFNYCIFQFNSKIGTGSAVNAEKGIISDLSFLNCEFIDNKSTSNGGALQVLVEGGARLIIANSLFDKNIANYQFAVGNYVGGALHLKGGDAILSNNRFTNNVSNSKCVTNFSCTVDGRGGAIFIQGSGNTTITNNIYVANKVTADNIGSFCGTTRAYGAGVFIFSGTVTSNNNFYSCNTTQPVNCGPVNLGAGIFVNSGTVNINHDTFARNATAPAIYVDAASTATIENSIIYNNNANATQISGAPTVEYSNIQGGGFTGVGNINLNPVFSGIGCEVKDLELALGSPSINTANPDTSNDDLCIPPSKDTPASDMGAYGGPGACGWVDPRLIVSPQSIEFGDVNAGISSVESNLTLTNVGVADLVLGVLSLGGVDASQFNIVSGKDNCSGKTLQVTDSCSITVEFAPNSVGGKSVEIQVPSNQREMPIKIIPLSGSGI